MTALKILGAIAVIVLVIWVLKPAWIKNLFFKSPDKPTVLVNPNAGIGIPNNNGVWDQGEALIFNHF